MDLQEQGPPKGKIYTERTIWFATFFGGPLVAGYLLFENFKAFGERERAKTALIMSIAFTILLFAALFLVPDIDKVPRFIIPLTYTAAAFGLAKHYQGAKISAHIGAGGETQSAGKAILVTVVGIVVLVLPILQISYLSEEIAEASVSTRTYGAIKNEITYDAANITVAEVDRIGASLSETGFFDEQAAKYVHVIREETRYDLFISVVEGSEKEPEMIKAFEELHKNIQTSFPNNKIVLDLVVDYIDNIVKKIE